MSGGSIPAPRMTAGPKLKLVGGAAAPDVKPPVTNPTPISGASDPRWVLAIRTAEDAIEVLENTRGRVVVEGVKKNGATGLYQYWY